MGSLINELSQIIWIRPWALWLLLVIPPVVFLGWQSLKNQGQWHNVIDAHLLKFLIQRGESSRSWWPLIALTLALTLAVLALAGPSFAQKPIPVYRTGDARVILLDLSLSMDAVDIKPSRMTRAKHKLTDILDASDEGETALIVYAGDAFIISPLTSDAKTIKTMVPVLSTGIMPVLGSEPYHAFKKAKELLQNAGKRDGQIIWITDGIDDIEVDLILEELKGTEYTLSTLVVATPEGAPIPLPNDKGFLKDDSGNIVMPTLDLTPLQKIANQHPTVITQITPDNRDIQQLMTHKGQAIDKNSFNNDEKIKDQLDQGYWLIIPVLFLAMFLFRKNARLPGLSFVFLVFFLIPPGHASLWDDLWNTKNQQAKKALENNQPEKAAQLFENEDWKASAHYKAGDYETAEQMFADNNNATHLYNKGNALAHQQKFDEAIEAYEQALELNPGMEDAQFNKELLEKLKEQQNQNNENQNQDKNQQSDDQQNQQNKQQENKDDPSDEEQKQQQQEQEGQENKDQKEQEQQEMNLEDTREEQEKDQALEQWLRKIPDDPGGLLRRKMYREYKKRGRENRYTKKVW